MTPLGNIESGIIHGDWKLVCDGFNKLTGKKLSPIVVKEPVKKFYPESATKRELYNWVKTKYDIAPIKAFTIEELREMVMVHSIDENSVIGDYEDELIAKVEVQKLSDKEAFLDGFRYHSGRKELLPIDKLKVTASFDPQLKGDDGPDKEVAKRDQPKKVNMKCLKCSKSFSNWAYLGVESGGELKALCPICAETV